MTPCPPFRIVPWDTDFLDALKNGVMKATRGQPGNAVVVFMHDRPRRYLRERFRYAPDVPKPCLIPRMFTERELMAAFRQEQHQKLRREAGKLDQIALLSRCVRELAEPDTELCMQLAKTDDAGFFPWGVRLADLLEECFTQGLTPEDMLYTEGEVAPFGAALLGSLGKIFRRYRDALIESDLTTPGFDAFVVASALEEGTAGDDLPPLPDFLAGRAILLAGFGMLTGTENTLFRYLWRHGAQVFLHVDPALAENGQGHWACTEQSNWIADWKADTVLACPSPGKKPKIHYFAGYDLHSQLDALRGDLIELERKDRLAAALKARSTTQQLFLLPSSENGTASPLPETSTSGNADNKDSITSKALGGRGKGTRGKGEGSPSPGGLAPTPAPIPTSQLDIAVALAHSGALLPVLHHLPRKDCNISLGYPLERSLLFRLLETVLDARNRRQPNGTTHWKALADLVRHPYLRLLEVNGISLRDIFQNMETRLRNGSRHADAHAVAEGAADDFFAASSLPNVAAAMPAIRELINRILRDTVDTWARAHTLGGLADALSSLCDTLLVYGSGNDENGAGNGKADIWSRFPIDAECLFRLMQRVIPALKDNGMAGTPLPWPLMQAMLLELVRAERVPFEADPLTGLQVLGMLETRLLRFSRVFLVDVTDDRLPGAPIRSPLLPDSLRALLGLPDTRNREQLAAYTFHRLIAGADEVWLYWQEGVETSGLFDGKKQRSRLVEELIWQEEQARGQRLKPGREPLRTAALDVRPPVRVRKVVPKTPAIREQIAASLKHPLSATRLDAYLTCPLRYYYERLCAIAPIDEVNEDDDPAAVGVLLHNVLRDFYAPAVGKTVRRDAQLGDPELPFLDEKALRALFRTALGASGLEAALPPESAAMLSVTGPERLGMFLRAQPEQTEVLSLEEEYDAEIRVGGRVRRLTGNLDRVDWREQEDPEGALDEGAVILDYKTGRIKALRPDIWADDAFWDALDPEKAAEAASEPDPEHDFLPIMAQRIPTVQLLYYCYLYGQATGKPVLDAAFVALGEDGGERPLFGKGMTIEERERALSLIPRLIGFILLHMELCPEFRPREGAHCRWCSWRNVCIISSQQ
ncbi:PD-(D/E)XK nuclease family protein [Bilophila wadsworthia]|uniref:PD-(D/E)XK nuclease family protein n=1 Tax=Bilophila wadsworthia TaxID=35833 RepID=UPI0026770FE4|nr:PD-(D/E)XK nuclease family protein [Bilophila wadsworthia]